MRIIDCMSEEKDAQQPAQGAVPESIAKLDLYAVLTKYDDPDAIDSKAIGEVANTNPQAVAAMSGQLKRNPKIYQKLLDAGWSEAQIPGWIARPAVGSPSTAERRSRVPLSAG